ncbi:Phosphate transport system permease protein PstC (TC 3.A.1.7.1) [hydrothermal vent metagenome]|uniref:Phosphate transport system permease protein PstC (TC 3.A.1.7.1) n=1 Tax=hydrothermal vent metagenome TaxID=652676 RepID=A0A3B1BXS0_9ZZZZ
MPDGWEAALLIPVVIGLVYFCVEMSPVLEKAFFGGDMPNWLRNELGINYDQRNALVVGLAMGFAVIPTIFSIAEDAIFAVPKHLVQGSLALGATPWQTMVRVVLLTASPGIFSAIMIGMGRAVGETMIVLMATGNTPVMDFSVFEGMRTLSANIAVEMPEAEVDSTHYRVLFLAAVVLFSFTFIFNTAAEIVRQRLRERYSNL